MSRMHKHPFALVEQKGPTKSQTAQSFTRLPFSPYVVVVVDCYKISPVCSVVARYCPPQAAGWTLEHEEGKEEEGDRARL